ncbi:hypothetical protein PG996_011622 [Apiospora saccharicola]|uniref:Heterokaryon incompatibility domain-containing protein n=1 Tax=Apiospora saccharicola TaxID=335842 RepID=A0ABR1UFJ6_9PEZI
MEQTVIAGASQDEGYSVLSEEPQDSGKPDDNDTSEESDGSDESDDSDVESSPSYWFSPEQVDKQVRLLHVDARGPFLCNQCRATNWSAALDHTSKAGQGASNPIDVDERVGLDPDCALCSLFARTFLSEVDESAARSAPWKLSAFNKRSMLVDSRIRYLFQPDVEVAILHSGATKYVQHINEERVEREGYLAFARTRDLRAMLEKNESTEAYPLSRFIGAQYDPMMVRGWLEACDIDLDDTFSIPGMRVIDCRSNIIVNYTAEMQYLALSYVWSLAGRDMVAVENRQFEGSALVLPPMVPRVVSNAMQVVMDLGYRYLWVDQICIDQSAGQEHIGDHISKMDLIYSNALATIIAASSKGALPGVGGTPRAGQMMLNIKGRVDEKMGTMEDDVTVFSTPPPFKYALPATVWHSRGWCFQESVLAPRRLYFMDYELIFQSEEIHASDSYPDPIVNQELIYDTSFPENPSLAWPHWEVQSDAMSLSGVHSSDDAIERFVEKFDHYQALLEVYTDKKLTMDSDSINGFAGAIKVFCRHDPTFKTTQGIPIFDVSALPTSSVEDMQALLAFQTESLVGGLCWFHDRFWIKGTPARRGCFPSWTWAGWGSKVSWSLSGWDRETVGNAESGFIFQGLEWEDGSITDCMNISGPTPQRRGGPSYILGEAYVLSSNSSGRGMGLGNSVATNSGTIGRYSIKYSGKLASVDVHGQEVADNFETGRWSYLMVAMEPSRWKESSLDLLLLVVVWDDAEETRQGRRKCHRVGLHTATISASCDVKSLPRTQFRLG